jgi:uracil-DNA glycosylase family 4
MSPNRPTRFPIYTEAHANCSKCELQPACEDGKVVQAYQPASDAPFNGIMIVGEGPGHHEVIQGRPFVGPSGRLLRAILKSLGADLDACYITNATLCRPPITASDDKRSFMQKFPRAVHSCLPRLELEITAVRPRVILALGAQALAALTGYEEHYTKLLPAPPCETCKGGHVLKDGGETPRRVVGVQCSKGECKHRILLPPQFEGKKVKGLDLPDILPTDCPKCGATLQRLTVRQIPCPTCGGLKRVETPLVNFRWDYQLGEVAGAVIDASKHGWETCGVRYVIATYHPSFLLRPPPSSGTGEDKAMGGQYAAPCVQKHMKKSLRLLTEDADWSTGFEVTDESDHTDAAAHLLDYIYGDPAVTEFTCDIESEGWGSEYVCQVCETKSGIIRTAPPTELSAELHHCETCTTAANAVLRAENKEETGPLFTQHVPIVKELDARKIAEVSKIKILGFASRKRGYSLVTDTRTLDPDNTSDPLYQAIVKVLTDTTLRICFHHGNYDVPALYKLWGIEVKNYTDDTLILHHDLYPDEKHSLSHVAFEFTDVHAWKPPKKLHNRLAHESFEEECAYNARDTMLTDDSLQQMKLKLAPKHLDKVYAIDMQLQQQAVEMWRNGMYVDKDNAIRIGQEAVDRELRLQAEMRKLLKWDNFNPRSATQLAEALFDRFGYTPSKMTEGGARSTAKEVVLRLTDSPFKRLVLDHKDAVATLANFFEVVDNRAYPGRSLRIWNDQRIRATWKAYGARTGRFSSNPNFQNWKAWLKALVTCAPGRKIVGADYDQLELRILAALSGDPVLMEKCLNADENDKLNPDKDPHSYVAFFAFGKLFTDLDKNDPAHDKKNERCKCQKCERKALRDICKRVIYGMNYGAGDETVLEAIYSGGYNGPPISLDMIGRVRKAIYTAFSGIKAYQEKLYTDAVKNKAIFSPLLGRRRIFPLGDVPFTEILNFPIQCLTGATRVLTDRGYQTLESLNALTQAHTGSEQVQARVLSKGAEQVWRVTLDNGQQIETNEGHYLLGTNGWLATGELQPDTLIAQPLAREQPTRRDMTAGFGRDPDTFYWLGYYVGNGSWDTDDAIKFAFGSRVKRQHHSEYATKFLEWARLHELAPQKPQIELNLTCVTLQNHAARELFTSLGVMPGAGAHQKRLPEAAWAGSIAERKAFLVGLLDADGSLATDPPNITLCNRALLQDVQLLLRTVGIPSRLYGPYVADRAGHLAWRLTIPGTLLTRLGYGQAQRVRYPNDVSLDPTSIAEFLDTFPKNPFSFSTQQSMYMLWRRISEGGFTNPHTLLRMWEALDATPTQPIYAFHAVRSVERLDRAAPMFTLHVDHPLHRYDSAGVISKNSGGADIMNQRNLIFGGEVRSIDPTAMYIAQVHDAVYYEVDEQRAPQVADRMTEVLTWDTAMYEGGPVMHFSAQASIGDTWKAAA